MWCRRLACHRAAETAAPQIREKRTPPVIDVLWEDLLSDGAGNPPWLLRLSAETVAALIRAQVPTLVSCAGGMSRSICIAASGLVLAERLALNDAIMTVAGTGPADVSPGLLAQLREALSG